MKNLILTISLVLIAITATAKEYSFNQAEKIVPGSEKIIVDDQNNTIKFIVLKKSQKITVDKNLTWLNTVLNVSNVESFKLYKTETDKYGFTHFKYKQYIYGYPVEDAVYYIHSKNGYIVSANGAYFPNIKLNSKSASISSAQAITIAKNKINRNGIWNDKVVVAPVKVVVSNGNGIYKLAYKTDVYSQAPLARKFVYVDATTGNVIKEINRIHNADAVGSAITKYSGTQTITADSIGASSYILKDNGRNVYTRDLDNAYFQASAVDFTDTDNTWNNVNAQQDEVATDAHWASEMFYDYFLTTFGRNSYDDAGAALNTFVHYGVNYDNAFWDGTSISCGDGDGTNNSPHTALDVICHEFSHGIIENTANLLGSYESGSLSESYGDIFGTAIEFFAKPGLANYTFAENISTSGIPSRSLSNPNTYGHPDTYLGTNWATGPADNGGIHSNCGVQNYWFYLLTNGGSGVNDIGSSYTVNGIGMANAVSIAYRTLTVYLTTNSQYNDARTFSIQAAVDLFGACSAEAVATQNAWYAVGIGSAATNSPVVAAFSSDVQFSCTVPSTVNFTDLSQNATISHKWYFGDGDSSSVSSPTHIYTSAGVYTVTLIVEGIGSCGTQSDTLIQVNYITVTNGGGPIAISCSPITTAPGAFGMGIYNFTLNTINNSTVLGGTDGYQDYTCGQSTNLTEGNSYNVSVTTGVSYNENVLIWIDFDNNGVFDPVAEKVFETNNIATNHAGSINIPAGAVLSTPLRLRVSSDYLSNTVGVCTNSQYGQHEDYTVVILPNTSPPVVDFLADDLFVNISQAVNFTDLSQNVPTGWTWDFTGATPSSSTAQNPTVSYGSLGSYQVKLRADNAFGADSLTKIAYINVVNQFSMCGGLDSTNVTSGQFLDSGGSGGNYGDNENCSFLINPGCAIDVTLTFTSFFSPTTSDFMLVYDGTDATGTLIGSFYSISTPPAPLTATSGSMFITWTSNGFTNYTGWDAAWSSTVPTSPPVANFSISDTNPPHNTVVDFTDLSTNFPGSWTWDFGDGNFDSSQNPSHIYSVPGTYTVQLITDNCFAADTISYNLTVQDSAFITIQPDTLFATSLCGDSIVEQLTIFNSGNGDLVTSILGASSPAISSDFYDGFESGSLASWTIEAGAYTKQITTSNPGSGTYALELITGAGAHLDGISHSFNNVTPDEISFKIKNSSTSEYGSFVIIGDNPTSNLDPMLYMFMVNNGTFYINGQNNISSYVANQWVLIELKNIDWIAKTMELHIDGSLVVPVLAFNNNSVTQLNKVHLYSWASTSTSSFDDIQIGENFGSPWMNMTTTDTIVPAMDSTILNVYFNASGLLAGTYLDTLTVTSNDSTNSPILVPVVFTVTGQPLISVTPSNFNFGSVQVGGNASDTLFIDNIGCDTLDISSFVSTNVSFTVNSGGFLIPPYSSDTVIITFSPDSIKTYADTIFINNNDAQTYVLVNGIGLGAPVISYNPTSIIDTVFGCNDSITIPVTIYNTGQGALVYQIDGGIGLVGDTSILVIQDVGAWGGIWMNTFIQTNYGLSPTLINSSAIAATNFMLYDIVITVGAQSNTYYSNISTNVSQFETFVNAGGIVQYQNASQGASGTNLVGGVQSNYGPQDNTNVNLLPTHPITLGLPVLLLGNSANHDVLSNIPGGAQIITETDATGLPTTIDYTFGAGRVVATGMTWTFLYNGGYNSGPMLTQSLEYIMSLIGSGSSWMSTTPDTGTVAINDSTILYVTLYSAGLSSGTYTSEIIISSNDPVSPSDTIPVSFTVVGTPEIALSDTCLNFGSIMENSTASDTLTVYNNGCDTLFVTNVTSGISEYTTSTTTLVILPGDSGLIDVLFSPLGIGTFNSSLTIYNNDIDTTICLNGSAVAAPIISTDPTSFTINLSACDDSITVPLTVYNTGGSNLEYEIIGAGGGGGTIELLALTYGVDLGTEYPNTIAAINTYFTNYNLTAINTTNAATLQAALVGKDVFLIPEQETGLASVFTGFATVLQNYVNNGGSVVFCGSGAISGAEIFNTGLFTGSFVSQVGSGTMVLVNPGHVLANSIVAPVLASNATFNYNITNGDAFSVAELNGSEVVCYREVGAGKVIIVGYDYYNTNSNSSRFIANAIEWAGIGSFASWMSLSQLTDTVVPGDSTVIYVTFYSAGLNGGTYNTDITINSNDPLNPQLIVPVVLNISFDPCAEFSYNIPNACSGQVDFTDETLNSPTSWNWTFGDSNSSTSQNPTNIYAVAGNYNVQLIACNATSCDTVNYIVNITNTNGPIGAACTPITTGAAGFGMGIFNVTFAGINNTTALGGTDGYQDYSCTASTTVTEGNTYAINVTTGVTYSEDVRVWIDFDNDGQFNMTNEMVFVSDNIFTNHSGNILIPGGSLLNTSLRMRVGSDFESLNFTTSCIDVTYGQYEDYSILIQSNAAPPVANYSYVILDQCQGIIQFTDLSTNFPTSWVWDFDDGTNSTFQNPFHTFASAGIYNVTLVATNAFGSSVVYNQTIVVNSLNATINILSPTVVNQPIGFSANAPGAISWLWDFGDGFLSTLPAPTHTYTSTGVFVVTLTATNGFGCVSTVYDTITITLVSIEELDNYFMIYPNPNHGTLQIINKSSKNISTIKIMNTLGELVFDFENKANNFGTQKIELTDVSTGIYFIKVLYEDHNFITRKFLIEK